MNKGIVALLVILALVVIVSPGILGRLAEKSVDDNLNWAAAESGDLVVTAEKFDRGWFSSEGQHRVTIKEGDLRSTLLELGLPDDKLPVLVINTHLDHGLIPVSSMSRENGSLAPGLGSAVSTLSVEFDDGESFEVPGKIFSKVGLNGDLESSYKLEAGSREHDGAIASWGDSSFDVTTNPSSGNVDFRGDIRRLSLTDGSQGLGVDALDFSGRQEPTKFGFATGNMKMQLDGLSLSTNGVAAGGLKRMRVDGRTDLDNGKVGGTTTFEISSEAVPQFGEVSIEGAIGFAGANADVVGSLVRTLQSLGPNPGDAQAFAAVEGDLKRLLASGLEISFNQFDVTTEMGTVTTAMNIKVLEDDASAYEWTSLLLNTEASADVSVPEAFISMMAHTNPHAGAVVGMGFLEQSGDVYTMKAEYKKGLLTINGQPMPIPLTAF